MALPESPPLPPLDADISPTNLVLGGADGEAFAFLSLRPRDASSPVCSLNTYLLVQQQLWAGPSGPRRFRQEPGQPRPQAHSLEIHNGGSGATCDLGKTGTPPSLAAGCPKPGKDLEHGGHPQMGPTEGPRSRLRARGRWGGPGRRCRREGLVPSFRALFVQRELPAFWPMLLCRNMSGSGEVLPAPGGREQHTPAPRPPAGVLAGQAKVVPARAQPPPCTHAGGGRGQEAELYEDR